MTNPFGLDEKEEKKAMEAKDIIPTLDLGKMPIGSEVRIQFLENSPREIEVDRDGEKEKAKVMTVLNIDEGTKNTLWLSAVSMKMAIFRLWKACNESLMDKKAVIKIREYKHEKFGLTRGYDIQEILGGGDQEE